jgi:hypothetical protein
MGVSNWIEEWLFGMVIKRHGQGKAVSKSDFHFGVAVFGAVLALLQGF